jgi:uncharacterized membrane protein YgcG
MTAHLALKDRQIEELQAQLRIQRLSSTPKDSTISSRKFSAGGSSYGGGGSSYGGGRGGGR